MFFSENIGVGFFCFFCFQIEGYYNEDVKKLLSLQLHFKEYIDVSENNKLLTHQYTNCSIILNDQTHGCFQL